jgi:hypothetical protein
VNLPTSLLEASDPAETFTDGGDLPDADLELSTLVLRHAGGALAEVDVLEAHGNGELRVRWRGSVGAAPYVVHVTKTFPPAKAKPDPRGAIAGEVKAPETRGPGLLWKGRAKAPLAWECVSVDDEIRIWRRMTGK